MRVAILAVMAVLFAAITGLCSPFVPLEWQSSVETGPFAGQKKYVGWIADQNADFVDDAFDAVPAGELVDTVIQLNACVSPEALEQVLGTYGKVAHIADTAMKDEALYPKLPAYNYQHRLRFNLKGAVPGATGSLVIVSKMD